MNLLSEKFVVLGLELLDNVFFIKQFLNGAVGLAQQVLDWGATVLAVRLPEVAIEESIQKVLWENTLAKSALQARGSKLTLRN